MPSHPSGTEYRTSEPSSDELSNRLPRFHAPLIPISTPNTVANSVPSPTSSTVGGSRLAIVEETGSPVRSETPSCPVSVARR